MCDRCFQVISLVKPLTDEKSNTVLDYFDRIGNESKRKPNKLWVDKEKLMLTWWLYDNDSLMNSIYSKCKSVVTERFIRILKGKIYKKMRTRNSCSYLDY